MPAFGMGLTDVVARVYVVPSTSRRNAAYSPEAVIGRFRALKEYLNEMKSS